MIQILLILSSFAIFAYGENNFLIVGGKDADRHEFPFIVAIRVGRGHSCGGSIINENWVLTAAHCMTRGPSSYTVVAGDHDNRRAEGTEQERPLSRIVNHPRYNRRNMENDYSMIRVSRPFNMSNPAIVGPIKIPSNGWNPEKNSKNAVVAGWGALSSGGRSPSVLQKVTVPLVSQEQCGKAYRRRMTDAMLCAGEKGKDSCQGDSGGPMLCKGDDGENVHCGVVSHGEGCGKEGYPGVYARTSHVESWIQSTSRN